MYLFKHLLLLIDLLKGKGHKYIKRVPVGVDKKTGRTRYRYVYNVTHKVHGKHIDDHDNMKVNSKYMFHSEKGEEVHVHVKKVNKDGSLVLMYDDGEKAGEEFTMTKKELAQKLREEHGIEEKFKEKREKVKRDLEIARKKGTDKQIKRLERELASLERGDKEGELPQLAKDLLEKHSVTSDLLSPLPFYPHNDVPSKALASHLAKIPVAHREKVATRYNQGLERALTENSNVLSLIEEYRNFTEDEVEGKTPEHLTKYNEYVENTQEVGRKLSVLYGADFRYWLEEKSSTLKFLKKSADRFGLDSDKPQKELANDIKDYIFSETGVDIADPFKMFTPVSDLLTKVKDEDFLKSKYGESFRTNPKDSPEYHKAKKEYIDYKKTIDRKLKRIEIRRGFGLDRLNFHTMQSTRHKAKDQVYEMLKQGATRLGLDPNKSHKELANDIKDYILRETGIDISKSDKEIFRLFLRFNDDAFLKTEFGKKFKEEESQKELTGREKAFEQVKTELKKTCEGLFLGSIPVSSEEKSRIESILNIPNSRTYKEQVKEVRDSAVQYLSMFSKLSPSTFEGRNISFKFRKNARAFCRNTQGASSIENIDLTRSDFQGVVLHELTHILDLDQKVLETAVCSFITRVKAGDSSRIYKGKSEQAFNDEFSSKYTGKLYVGQRNTEFMSMGVENFHDLDALTHFAINDPHHFATIFATLKGYMK
jgi:hypothetical protein